MDESDPGGVETGAGRPSCLEHDLRDVDVLASKTQRRSLSGCELSEVVDDSIEPKDLVVQRLQTFRISRDEAVSQLLQARAQYGKRGAQFMRNVGGHLAPDRLGALNVGEGRIDRSSEITDLGGVVEITSTRTYRAVTCGNMAGDRGHSSERVSQSACHKHGNNRRKGDCE